MRAADVELQVDREGGRNLFFSPFKTAPGQGRIRAQKNLHASLEMYEHLERDELKQNPSLLQCRHTRQIPTPNANG